ncbi:MAG: DUF4082 domain-containing protein, partial [Chitinophagaceae bacterium]|nr:DUF4082 domain-containing protein [Chitinophagaceae bacterium]
VTVNPDLIRPVVSSTNPLANALNVAINSSVTAVFSEALNAATISGTTAYIQSGGTTVSAAVNYAAGSQSLVLTPSSPLGNSTQYTVTLKGGSGGIADLAGNAMATDYSWSFTTAAADLTAPVSNIVSPVNGASTPVNQQVTITGTASDAGGLNRVEVSVNGGTTWQTASGTTNWTYTWTPVATGSVTIKSRAIDIAGNTEATGTAPAANAITVTVSTVVNPCPCTIYTTQLPTISNQRDNTIGIVVGTRFRSNVSGYVTALRFYKGAGNTGTHTGQLHTSSGTLLATAVYTNETTSGWQTVTLQTPVAITAGTDYIVSYHSSQGYYSVTANQFANSIVNGPLTAPADAPGADNGVYVYFSVPVFPNGTYLKEGYFVDVVFNTIIPGSSGLPGQSGMLDQDHTNTNPAINGNRASKQFTLYQNAPNPSNGWTKIRYSLPKRVKVTIGLYDIQGRLVRLLINDIQEAGDQALELDTRTLTKGVYYYRMQAEGYYGIKRLVVE